MWQSTESVPEQETYKYLEDLLLLSRLRKRSYDAFRPYDFSFREAIILLLIADGVKTSHEIADKALLTPASVSLIITKFTKRGLLTRHRKNLDKRLKQLTLTQAGHEKARQLKRAWEEEPSA